MRYTLSALIAVAVASLVLFGCAKQADPNKPIDEIKTEVEKMSVGDLESSAKAYATAIKAKTGDLNKIREQLKALPPKELLSEKAKQIREEISAVAKEIAPLRERYDIYVRKLKEKGGDLTKVALT